MTCIAARVTPGGVLTIAADSATSYDGGECVIERTPKVWQSPRWGLVAGAGDSAALLACADLIEHAPDLQRLCETLARSAHSESSAMWLLYHAGGLVRVYVSGAVVSPAGAYDAIGSGAEVALGALACRASPRRAVEAACAHRVDCAPPVLELSARVC